MSLALIDNDLLIDSILQTNPCAIVVIDCAGTVISFSPAGETIVGWDHDEIIGGNVSKLMPEEHAGHHDGYINRYIETGHAKIIGRPRTMHARHRDGHHIPVRLSIGEFFQNSERYFVGFLEDRTQLEEARQRLSLVERALDRVSRLSAMGTVASLVAHDLAQPLTAAASRVEAVDLRLENRADAQDETNRRDLAIAVAEIRRAAGIVHQVRQLIQGREPERVPEDFNAAVREACLIASRGALEAGVRMDLSLAEDVPPVSMDRLQIQQVVINLVRNAFDAVRGQDLPTVWVATHRNGEFAVLEVGDDGPGIAPEVGDRLFEPFATTKDDGLGLGLTIGRTCVEAHGGRLEVARDGHGPERGAVMRMSLPLGPDGPASAAGRRD